MADPDPATLSGATRPAVARRDDRDADDAAALPVDLDVLATLLGDVLAAEGASVDAEATLQLVSPAAIAELKAEHFDSGGNSSGTGGGGERGDGDGPTDVLSFPIDGTDPDATIIGDVVVCPEVALAQAAEHAGDLDSELALLVVHGGLHLCGWDHADDADRDRMWARERELLAAAGRSPRRDPWATGAAS